MNNKSSQILSIYELDMIYKLFVIKRRTLQSIYILQIFGVYQMVMHVFLFSFDCILFMTTYRNLNIFDNF